MQLIPYASQLISDPFLDLGQRYFGAGSIEDMIVVEGYVDFIRTIIEPFNDLDDEKVVDQLALADTSQNALFISVLKKLDINLDEDIRQTYTQKSATAGYTIYGPNQARYGTDSVAYVGWSRGS